MNVDWSLGSSTLAAPESQVAAIGGMGLPAAWILADIVRMEDAVLAEHWDVIQDEATREQSRSGLPMFGDKFPAWPRPPKARYRPNRPRKRLRSTLQRRDVNSLSSD